jgi:DNA-binding NarL/FixJ family response regulator
MKKKIRVLIADDHHLFREMLFHTLSEEEDIEVVGEACDGRDAIEKAKSLRPEIILLDINMPYVNGLEAIRVIKSEYPECKVVILTALEEDSYIFKFIKEGATGYLMKDTSAEEVIRAIRSAYSGESLVQPRVVSKILREFCKLTDKNEQSPGREKHEILSTLTEREKEVLGLVAQGLNNREIASSLFISEATVKSHVANLMNKLNLRDRVEMVLFALKSGMSRI